MQRKKAISLIVLVITIIVMVVLVGTIIISLNNNGIMTKANNSVKKSNLKEVQTMADMYWGEAYSSGITTQSALDTYVREKLIATLGEMEYGNYTVTVTERGTTVDILTGVVLNTSAVTLNIEDEEVAVTTTLTATLKNISGTVSWTTSDENVVSISGTGNTITVTAVAKGITTITATCGKYNTSCTVTVTEPFWDYAKDSNNKYTLVSNGKQTLGIGDTINYVATGTNYTGEWCILGVNENGEILIMARENVRTIRIGDFSSSGITRSYSVNGKDNINSVCNNFGTGIGASQNTSSRSVTVEDINKVTGYNPLNVGVYDADKTGSGAKYNDGNYNYNDTEEYTSGSFYNGYSWVSATSESPITETQTYYNYYPNTLTASDSGNIVGLNTSVTQENKINNMIFKNTLGTDNVDAYCLASHSIKLEADRVYYDIYIVSSGKVDCNFVYSSAGSMNVKTFGVRPVVALASDIQIVEGTTTDWAIVIE